MMDDLISRKAAIDAIEEYADRLQIVDWKENPGVPYKAYALNWCINTIRDLPPAQPERKKGKWIYLDKGKRFSYPHIVKCSVCDNILDMYGVNAGRGDANFCPNCGADMREDGATNADVES